MLDKLRAKRLRVGINTVKVRPLKLPEKDENLLEVKLAKDRNPHIVRSDKNVSRDQWYMQGV